MKLLERRTIAVVVAIVAAGLAACGGMPPGAQRAQRLLDQGDYAGARQAADQELGHFPRHPTLWHVKIRAALGQGDASRAVADYAAWRKLRGDEDRGALKTMALTTIWQGLRAPSASLRVAAVQAVERHEIDALAQAVAQRMEDDDDSVAAAAAIAVLRAYPQAPDLATRMMSSDNPVARLIAIEGVARKVGKYAHDDLALGLRDPDARVRAAAARALAAMKDPADTANLTASAAGDPDGQVRAEALQALAAGNRGDLVAVGRKALADQYLGARLAAVALLERARDRATIEAAVRGPDKMVALRAAVALRKLGGAAPEGLAAAVKAALADPAWPVRASGLNSAGAIVDGAALTAIAIAALADTSVEVRLAAARLLLAHDGRDRALPVLVAALAAPTPEPRLEAAIDLARLEDERGVETIAALAGNADAGVRTAAVRAHGTIRRITPALVAALADASPAIRIEAASTLLGLLPDD
jgi:HEAT repeat protein